MPSTEPRTRLPGFGLPVNAFPPWSHMNTDQRFPHAIADFVANQGLTLRERRMLDFMTQITDKPDWDRKVFDDVIVAKWKAEACRFDGSCNDQYLSHDMFAYVRSC